VNWHEVFPVTSASATDIHREKTKTATPPPTLEPKLIRPIAIRDATAIGNAPDCTPTILCVACGDTMKQHRTQSRNLDSGRNCSFSYAPPAKEVEAKELGTATRFAQSD
jgi:hypothetical protein